jgi:hypothetical protein
VEHESPNRCVRECVLHRFRLSSTLGTCWRLKSSIGRWRRAAGRRCRWAMTRTDADGMTSRRCVRSTSINYAIDLLPGWHRSPRTHVCLFSVRHVTLALSSLCTRSASPSRITSQSPSPSPSPPSHRRVGATARAHARHAKLRRGTRRPGLIGSDSVPSRIGEGRSGQCGGCHCQSRFLSARSHPDSLLLGASVRLSVVCL